MTLKGMGDPKRDGGHHRVALKEMGDLKGMGDTVG